MISLSSGSPYERHHIWTLKREYDTREAECDAYDAMLAHNFELLASKGRLLTWQSESELVGLARNGVPGLDAT